MQGCVYYIHVRGGVSVHMHTEATGLHWAPSQLPFTFQICSLESLTGLELTHWPDWLGPPACYPSPTPHPSPWNTGFM